MPKLYLIEGHSAFFRAYHVWPPMQLLDGTPCNAMYGYAKMLWGMLNRHNDGSHLAVILDAPNSRNYRRNIYPEYKANRSPPDIMLSPQLPRIREVTEAFGIPCVEVDGYEADDVIASYACQAASEDMEVVIVTIDKDLMQLVGDRISVYTNIDTATSMSPGMRATLAENRDDVFLSLELATLKLDVPLETPIADFVWTGIDHDRLQVYLREQGFRSLEEEMAA